MTRIQTFSIQSGSNGNCVYVEAGGKRLLFDAGVSGKVLRTRMAEHGRSPDDVDALFISHEHSDHVRCAGVFQRLFDLPIYMTHATHRATRCDLGRLQDVRYFNSGETIEFGPVRVHTVPTPHDAVDTVMFVVEFDGARLAILTDLGHAFKGLVDILEQVDAAYLESNYDPDMLETGPYPPHLKARIAGNGGHVSNVDSAQVVRKVASSRHKWIALSHLSEQNNQPELALATHREIVGATFPFDVSSRYAVSPLRCV